jgi:hypothetical protein
MRAGLFLSTGAAALATILAASPVAAADDWTKLPLPDDKGSGVSTTVADVAVFSDTRATAVGYTFSAQTQSEQTRVMRWDGTRWASVPSPTPGASNTLLGVSGTSPSDVWAVGTKTTTINVPLLAHWNGSRWKDFRSPLGASADTTYDGLSAVSARTPSDAWAVGTVTVRHRPRDLILHWNGTAWSRSVSPAVGTESFLYGVQAIARDDAWAVGATGSGACCPEHQQSLVLHWNGATWSRVPSPNGSAPNTYLKAVSGSSASRIWAVGSADAGLSDGTSRSGLLLRWNGQKWKVVSDLANAHYLDVAATSRRNAWVVGDIVTSAGDTKALILHWNGQDWVREKPPGPHSTVRLTTVGASSRSNAWALGTIGAHCCG